MSRLRITSGTTGGPARVEVDGHDIAAALVGLVVDLRAGEPATVTLDPAVFAASIELIGPQVRMTTGARDLLERLGWTPPDAATKRYRDAVAAGASPDEAFAAAVEPLDGERDRAVQAALDADRQHRAQAGQVAPVTCATEHATDTPPRVVLCISRSSSRCSACGRSALPHEPAHATPCGYDNHSGCGATYTHVTSDCGGLDQAAREMRPDLPWIDYAETIRHTPPALRRTPTSTGADLYQAAIAAGRTPDGALADTVERLYQVHRSPFALGRDVRSAVAAHHHRAQAAQEVAQ